MWHGASWTFVAWGGLHGLYLVGERLGRRALPPSAWRTTTWARLAYAALTFVLVCVAWVFFRAGSFGQAFSIIEAMVHLTHGKRVLSHLDYEIVGFAIASIVCVHWIMRDRSIEDVVGRTPWPVRSLVLAGMIVFIILMQGPDRAFIYFQF